MHGGRRRLGGWRAWLLAAAGVIVAPGCSELVLEGMVSDRETARTVPGVQIAQKKAEAWRSLGETDGRGRYWIIKSNVTGGGQVRLSKPGYRPAMVSESEFLAGQSFVIIPTDHSMDMSIEGMGDGTGMP